MIWLPLIAMAANMAQKKQDDAYQRQHTAGQMEGDYASSLTGGGNSYRAPPPVEKNADYSALFSLFGNDKNKAAQRASDTKTMGDGLVDPWSQNAGAQKKNMESSWWSMGGGD